MSDPRADEILMRLLEDPSFARLLKRSRDDYLSWEEFLRMDLPASMNAMGTWELLSALHRDEALTFPAPRIGDAPYWYTKTHWISDHLSTIDRMCTRNSCLYRTVTGAPSRPFLVQSRISDIVAAAKMDGLDISGEAARQLLHLERAPRDDIERLLVNTMAVVEGISDSPTDRPFSPEYVFELRERLLDGLTSSSLPRVTPTMGLVVEEDLRITEHLSAEERIDFLCAYANNEIGDPYDHPAIRSLVIADMMRSYHPLPDMNSQVGRLMARIYAFKNDLPVLGMLPITRAKVSWEAGKAPYDRAAVNRASYMARREMEPLDATSYLTVILDLAVIALDDLAESVRTAELRDSEIKRALSVGPGLNHRQRSILVRAIRNPEAEFRIGYHKKNHGITYATARKDLVGLEEAGYLVSQRKGRAFVYSAANDLKVKLGGLPDQWDA